MQSNIPPKGGRSPVPSARAWRKRTAGYITEIAITDTGIGISEEFQSHIFESFSRERSSTVSGIEGTGLAWES